MAGCKHTCKYHFGWVTCWSCSYFSVPNLLTYAWHPSQGTGFWQGTSSVLGHLLFFLCDAICIPASWSLLKDPFCQVFFGCPLFLFPGGFHVKACLVFAVYVRSILFNTTAKKNKKTNKKTHTVIPKLVSNITHLFAFVSRHPDGHTDRKLLSINCNCSPDDWDEHECQKDIFLFLFDVILIYK